MFLVFNFLGDALTSEEGFTNNPESQRADTLLEERLRGPERFNEIIIARSESMTVDDPAFRELVEGLYRDVKALGNDVVGEGTNYYQTGDESLVSTDRHTTILPFILAGTVDDILDNVKQVRDVVHLTNGN